MTVSLSTTLLGQLRMLAWNQRRCAQGHRWPVPFGTRHHHSPVGR